MREKDLSRLTSLREARALRGSEARALSGLLCEAGLRPALRTNLLRRLYSKAGLREGIILAEILGRTKSDFI